MNEQEVLKLDLAGIQRLTTADFSNRRMTENEFAYLAGLTGGDWQYLGDPRPTAPHMLLRSGLHSGFYINCSLILAHATICEIVAAQMIEHCIGRDAWIDWVVSAAIAGIPLGQEIARQLRACAGFVEKGEDGKLSAWRFQIPSGSRVLLVNELITTPGGSLFETKQTVQKENQKPITFLLFAAVMVDRCKSETLDDGTLIKPLFKFDFPAYPAGHDTCPFCKAGSQVVKGKVNFRQLWQEQLDHQRGQ